MRLSNLSYLFTFLFSVGIALGQVTQVPYDPSPFSAIGIIQAATVNNVSDVLSGGTLRVNDINIVIPRNLLVTLPSITVSWAELFNADGSLNLPRFGAVGWEVSVYANRLGNTYVAGIVYIFQEFGHASSGFITAMDYTTGEMWVGGDFANPTSGTRVVINDPVGRFGMVHGSWPLWTADTDNPSIRASTGFPMCFPRTNPAVTDDPLCPKKNRPLNSLGQPLSTFNFDAPPVAAGRPDPNVFAPLMVGDWIVYSGVYVEEGLVAAFSIEANLGLYTAAGTSPVYLTIVEAQFGIVGNPAGEIAQTRIEGYTTDETQNVEVYAIDVDPCTGVETERVLAVVVPRPDGRRGQWRYRPDPDITPATREVGARVQAGTTVNANGITTGQFIQPIMDDGFIFPELDIFGQPQIVYDFDVIPFLARGSGPWLGGIPGTEPNPNGPIVGQLSPWPGALAPTPATCSATAPQIPVANAGSDATAAAGKVVTLSGRSDTSNLPESSLTYLWDQVGTGPDVVLTGANTKTATFTAPSVTGGTTLTFMLIVSNAQGSTNDTVVVSVADPAQSTPDTVTIVSVDYSSRRGAGQLTVVARTSVTDGSAVLSLSAVNPDVASTAMTSQGNGQFQLLVNVKPEPVSITVTSSRGGSVTQILDD